VARKKRPLLTLLVVLLLTGIVSCARSDGLVTVTVGDAKFRVEVARTPEERQTGLMYRQTLAPQHGMLFVFPEEAPRTFWMKNTPIPLSIAYISRDGIIQSIQQMTPNSEMPVPSRLPAKYALEVNQGEFRELGISPGAQVMLPAGLHGE